MKVIDPETNEQVDQVMNLNDRVITKSKDIITVVQEIAKNREKLAKKVYNTSIDELKRKSHLVIALNLYSDFGKPSEDKISELMFTELCGSEQAAMSSVSTNSRTMTDKEFASKSFNSLSQEIVNNTVNKNKAPRSREGGVHTILSMICSNCIKNPRTNVMFVCKVSPDATRFKHSLTAIKFSSKLHSVVRKRIKLKIPEERKLEGPFEVASGRHETEYASASKQSELLSNYITETEQSQSKSTELLGYLISDLKVFLEKPEQENLSERAKDEWFEECQEKISHIEDIIKRLSEDARNEFLNSGKSHELKYLMDQVRSRRKNFIHQVNDIEPCMFEQSKQSFAFDTLRSNETNKSKKKRTESASKMKENSSLAANSTGYPISQMNTSSKHKRSDSQGYSGNKVLQDKQKHSFYGTQDTTEPLELSNSNIKHEMNMSQKNDRIRELEEKYNNLNSNRSRCPKDQSMNFNNSLPPPHPSKFGQKRFEDRNGNRINQDLESETDRRGDFLTMGRDSR